MDAIRFFFSAPIVILLSLALLWLFYITGIPSNPGDVLAPALDGLSNWIHGAIFPALFIYWTATFCINRFQ